MVLHFPVSNLHDKGGESLRRTDTELGRMLRGEGMIVTQRGRRMWSSETRRESGKCPGPDQLCLSLVNPSSVPGHVCSPLHASLSPNAIISSSIYWVCTQGTGLSNTFISFSPHAALRFLSLLHRWVRWGSKRSFKLPGVTELEMVQLGFECQSVWLQVFPVQNIPLRSLHPRWVYKWGGRTRVFYDSRIRANTVELLPHAWHCASLVLPNDPVNWGLTVSSFCRFGNWGS